MPKGPEKKISTQTSPKQLILWVLATCFLSFLFCTFFFFSYEDRRNKWCNNTGVSRKKCVPFLNVNTLNETGRQTDKQTDKKRRSYPSASAYSCVRYRKCTVSPVIYQCVQSIPGEVYKQALIGWVVSWVQLCIAVLENGFEEVQ